MARLHDLLAFLLFHVTFLHLCYFPVDGAAISVDSRLKLLEEQVRLLQKQLQQSNNDGGNDMMPMGESLLSSQNEKESEGLALPDLLAEQAKVQRDVYWQPFRRAVFWQPMKKSSISADKEQVIIAVENRLMEVIRAGEKLGVTAYEVLTHLRMTNAQKSPK